MPVKEIWSVTKQTIHEWMEDNVSRLAAALAYYTIFALAPLLVIAIFVAGLIWGESAAQQEVYSQLEGLVGGGTAAAVQEMVTKAADTGSGTWATLIGVVLLIYGSTNVFASLQDSLNTIWEVKPDPNASWWLVIRNRLFSFAMVLGVGFLLLVSLVISAVVAVAVQFFGGSGWFWQGVNFLVFIPIAALLFAMIYKFLPDVKIRWSDVWIGAFVTAVLFALGKLLIGLYIGQSSVTSVYGAAGSLAALLIWIYYASQILFFGAEFTQVYAKRYGRQIEPGDYAVPVTEEERAQQGIPSKQEVDNAARQKRHQVQLEFMPPAHPLPTARELQPSHPDEYAGHRRISPTVAAAGLLPVDPTPYTRTRQTHLPRFSPLVAAVGSAAAGLVLGGVSAYAADHLRRRTRDQAQIENRIDAVHHRLHELSRSMADLRHRQPGVATLWPALKQSLGSSHLRPDRRSRLRRWVERAVMA